MFSTGASAKLEITITGKWPNFVMGFTWRGGLPLIELSIPMDNLQWPKAAIEVELLDFLEPYSPLILSGFYEEST